MHDADIPFSDEAWDLWSGWEPQVKAMAFLSLSFQPRGNTIRNHLAITRDPLLRGISHLSLRVAGALNGRNNLSIINLYQPVLDESFHK